MVSTELKAVVIEDAHSRPVTPTYGTLVVLLRLCFEGCPCCVGATLAIVKRCQGQSPLGPRSALFVDLGSVMIR